MSSSAADVLFLVAPAGYGKTEAARKLSEQYEHAAWCDCAPVHGARDLLAAALGALARAEGGPLVTQAQIEVARSTDEVEMLAAFERAWTAQSERGIFIFENCEQLASDGPLCEVLYRLLVTAPAGRRMVVCSRTPLRVRTGRYLPPHRVLKLSVGDFTLSDEEAADLLDAQAVPRQAFDRIISVARGWPVVLLLLGRLAAEGRLAAALDDANTIEFDDLFQYCLHEVLWPLGIQERRLLLLASVVPDLNEDELTHALQASASDVRIIAHELPLLRSDGGEYYVHPLLGKIIKQDARSWADEVRALAAYNEHSGRYRRAGRLYREAHDENAAARSLAALPTHELLMPANLVELSYLPVDALAAHPQLAIGILYSTSPLRNAPSSVRGVMFALQSAFVQMADDEDPDRVAGIVLSLTAGLWFFGLRAAHHAVLSDERTHRALHSGSPTARLLLVGTPETLGMLDGKIESNYAGLVSAFEETRGSGMVSRAAQLVCSIAIVHRWRGDADAAFRWYDEGIKLGIAAKSPGTLLANVVLACVNGWFWHGDEGLSRYQEVIDSCSRDLGVPIDFNAVDVDDGTLEITAGGITLPAAPALELLLMRAARCTGAERLAIFKKAERVLHVADPMITALYYLARASCATEDRATYFKEARSIISTTEARAFEAAIVAAMEGQPSFLDAFLRRFSIEGDELPVAQAVEVKLMREVVCVGTSAVRLTKRELSFLAFVARIRIPSTRDEIQEALWPDLDERGARDALYSLVHRLRKRVGVDLVRTAGNAYAIADGVRVDIWDLEQLSGEVQRNKRIDEGVLLGAFEAARNRAWPQLLSHEWFSLVDFRVAECQRAIVKRLIELAQRRKDYRAVEEYAESLIAADECDEWAYQELMRAHIDLGEQLDAARAYRNYRSILRRQLSAEPSEEMMKFAARVGL